MYIVLLGVARQVMGLWCDASYSKKRSSLRRQVAILDIRPAASITRLPRCVSDASRWKASEWRGWLLFYSGPLLKVLLEEPYLTHWLRLVTAVNVLLHEEVTSSQINSAEKSLNQFFSQFAALYGNEHMSYNVQCLLHLAESVRRSGPL